MSRQRCYSCGGNGRTACPMCGGRGGTYRLNGKMEMEFSPCYPTVVCRMCGGSGYQLISNEAHDPSGLSANDAEKTFEEVIRQTYEKLCESKSEDKAVHDISLRTLVTAYLAKGGKLPSLDKPNLQSVHIEYLIGFLWVPNY